MIRLLAATTAIAFTSAAALASDLPLRGDDLAGTERYTTGIHTLGVQAEGKDIGARRHVSDTSWSHLKTDGADGKVNANWVVYGKPFYAMAAGTVVGCWRNAPDNIPGSLNPDYKPNLKFAGGGNHLWVLQDDGVYALYAHAQPGSIPANICPHSAKLFAGNSGKGGKPDIEPEAMVANGAKIKAGQFLGRIGNSGASDGPHLHVHLQQKDGTPVPMRFARGLTTPFTDGKASLNGPWTALVGKTMPAASILFWPPRPTGNYTFNGIKGSDYQRLAEHLDDSNVMPKLVTCAANGATYNSTWLPDAGTWATAHGPNATIAAKHASYTAAGYQRTSNYTCGSVTASVWRK